MLYSIFGGYQEGLAGMISYLLYSTLDDAIYYMI